jgi:hypothetical protein
MVRERSRIGLGLGKKCEFYQLALRISNTEKVKVKRQNKIMEWFEIIFGWRLIIRNVDVLELGRHNAVSKMSS